MVTIRSSRLNKNSNNKWKVLIAAQLISVLLLIVFITGFITSNTGAYFNDTAHVSGNIQIGTWISKWTGSSLEFPNKKDRIIESCNFPVEISAQILNTGSAMNSPLKYEVYLIQGKVNTKVDGGTLEPLAKDESVLLKYNALQPGNYKFRAFQPLGHGNKDEIQDLWSETITISCKQS